MIHIDLRWLHRRFRLLRYTFAYTAAEVLCVILKTILSVFTAAADDKPL